MEKARRLLSLDEVGRNCCRIFLRYCGTASVKVPFDSVHTSFLQFSSKTTSSVNFAEGRFVAKKTPDAGLHAAINRRCERALHRHVHVIFPCRD